MATTKVRTTFLYAVVSIFFFASLFHHYLHNNKLSFISLPPAAAFSSFFPPPDHNRLLLLRISENLAPRQIPPQAAPLLYPSSLSTTVSILLPAWEVLVIASAACNSTTSDGGGDNNYVCLFPNKETSPALFDGFLRFPDRSTFKCLLPARTRRKLPFPQPLLTRIPENPPERNSPLPVLLRWTYLVYESLTTENDVIIFLKGLNNRQGFNRKASEFNCVFFHGDDVDNGVRSTVTHSMQEVFRCHHPLNLTAVKPDDLEEGIIKITLETVQDKKVVPTVAYYNPPRKLAKQNVEKALLCACTMVYNVAKFLKEWVHYHSKIGVQKFILHDNGSHDNLEKVSEELNNEGFYVKVEVWPWQKTQEAAFSHAAVYTRDSCSWMAYIDVDEFIFSPSWLNSQTPSSKSMLHSLLQQNSSDQLVGQVYIGCREFGPSNQAVHPVMGVTQGYNCRRHIENRHKSIVYLEGINDSLVNVIHHFQLKPGFRTIKMNVDDMALNHYKFQAWPEFKAKFRRRVSAYVVDWTQQVNPTSNDRTPGLGFSAVEPKGWPHKFCEVVDNGLRELTQKWFSQQSPSGYLMAWQRR